MKEWSGLERVFRLSLGVQVGANALALLAALEFKQHLQMDLLGPAESNNQLISISSEEWRSTAGIFDRKAYDRAKAKLVEAGIIHIQQEGRVLRVTLWPNLEKDESNQAIEAPSEPQIECGDRTRIASSEDKKVSVIMEAPEGTVEEAVCETIDETEHRTTDRTSLRTTDETTHRTVHGTTHGTVDASIPETDKRVTLTPELSTSFSRSPLDRYSLNRSPLTLSSWPRYSQSNPSINLLRLNDEERNNELRNNEQRYNELRIRVDLKESNNAIPPSLSNPNGLLKGSDISTKFKRLWQSEIGHALTRYEEEGLERFLRLGFTEEILLEALRCAVLADQRQMGYLLGILRNWYRAGVRHPRDILLVRQSWEDQRFIDRAPVPV